ncbi:MAG: thioredoxin family protein [Alphaproteobacteria bacterium]|nr:thioredoxin family protein [Alphaproteobacteria bacterium]
MVDLKKRITHKSFLEAAFLFLSVLSLLFFPLQSSALFEAESGVSNAKLISSVSGEGDQTIIWIGLDIDLKPGWKTYWRTPGTSAYSLKIDWSESQNLKSADIYWPVPDKIESLKVIANGYKDDVFIPIKITLKKRHIPLSLKAKLDYLVCDSGNCIPQSKTVTLVIPDRPSLPSADATEIASAIKHLPEKNNPDLSIKSAQFIQNENAESYLRLVVFHTTPLVTPEVFVEGGQRLFFDDVYAIRTVSNTDGKISTIDVPIYKSAKRELGRTQNLIGKTLTVTLESGDEAVEKTILVTPPPISLQATLLMYGFAFLGGFILNFMPCVLPVILLKIFSLTTYGGASSSAVRSALFLSVMGILSSFIILGLVPILLNLLGISFGWGMQFQEPIFLVFMMLILTLFTANFWGFYEIILPAKVAALGYKYGDKQGNAGHFLSGMFATLLATPCSAPYLGTAVTFALSRGPLEILLVFFFLGLGLSLPFILVMIYPKVATYLPKPGKWMIAFKQILGWGFFFTMLWLFYVLTSQVSLVKALMILSALLLIIFIFWLHHRFPSHRRLYLLSALAISTLPFLILSLEYMKKQEVAVQTQNVQQVANIIKSDLKAGKLVLVDVTADWCLTCKVNEFFVLDTEEVKNLMKANGVALIKIDWTSKDPEVYEYLKSFNRNGIPFYVIYGPHLLYGQPLPQILTFSIMDEAIKKAK